MTAVPTVRPPLRFEILGPVRAIRDGREIDLGPAKQRAVLAVLLLSPGRAVPTHQIVDAVWGEGPPENGANVVQKYVAGLRRVLDPDRSPRTPGELLALTSGGYLLHVGAGALDVEQFSGGVSRAAGERAEARLTDASRTLRHALGLWRGEALAGLAGTVFDAARDRLAETHATAWEAWAEIELARGNHSVLVPDLVRLVAEFPLREGLRSLLMIALYQGGRQAEALTVFRDARRHLDEEFGVEPGERLQETHRRILRSDPVLAAPQRSTVQPAEVPPPHGIVPSQRPTADDGAPLTSSAPALRSAAGSPSSPASPVNSAPPIHSAPPISPAPPESPGLIHQGAAHPGFAPLDPGRPHPRTQTTSVPLVFAAVVLPLFSCGLASWVMPAYCGWTRRDIRHLVAAAGYLLATVFLIGLFAATLSPADAKEASNGEMVSVLGMVVVMIVSAVHGGLTCGRPPTSGAGHRADLRVRRDNARRMAHTHPATALELGVGRPDLPRWFDDGGLVDLNHAPGHVLAGLRGVTPDQAHRIVVDRTVHGVFRSPDDLVIRGLLPPAVTHRLAEQLVCVPPAAARPPAGEQVGGHPPTWPSAPGRPPAQP